MIKVTLYVLLFVSGLSVSCKKDFKCPYTPCSIVAPASEIQQVEMYLSSKNITAIKHCSGLYYTIESAGSGAMPSGCSSVTVNYSGWLTNGTVFDKSTSPVSFSLVQLIEGWKAGLPLISKGGRIKLYTPPSLGYGASPNGSIPANSILVFDIELLDVQ